MTGWLSRCAGWLLNQIRVNHVHPAMRNGVPVFIKRRRVGGTVLIWFGNQLLSWADSGMCMSLRLKDWLRWEIQCFTLLYPDRPEPRVEGGRALVTPALGGTDLRAILDRQDEAAVSACVLAARELRRVHQIGGSDYHGLWSHGDLHLANILCDMSAERAYLLDFDIHHRVDIAQPERQADDLKSVLLELIGRPDEQWHLWATAFLDEYREPPVLEALSRQLVVPQGFARLLLHIKTNGAPLDRVRPRLEIARRIAAQVATDCPPDYAPP